MSKHGKVTVRGQGPITKRQRDSIEGSLNLNRNLSPKSCPENMSSDGRNVIATGTYDIPLGVTLSIEVDDELVVI